MPESTARPHIDILLPFKEVMTAKNAGAVASIVHDLVSLSAQECHFQIFGRPLETASLCAEHYTGLAPSLEWVFGHNTGFARSYLAQSSTRHSPDAIEIHNRCQIARYIASKRPHVPVFLYLHNDPRDMKGGKSIHERRWLVSHLSGIFCVSDYIKDCFLDGLSVTDRHAEKLITIPNGVRRHLASPQQKTKTIVIAGRMVPEKGIFQACQAISHILPQHPDWSLHIIGGKGFSASEPSDYELKIKQILAPLGKQAVIHGFMDKETLRHWQTQAGIIISPSLWPEPAGLVNLEALAAGACLIATDTGGAAEYLKGRAHLITPEQDTQYAHGRFPKFQEQLQKAVAMLIRSPQKRLELEKHAWNDFPFTAHNMAKQAVNARKNRLNAFTTAAH